MVDSIAVHEKWLIQEGGAASIRARFSWEEKGPYLRKKLRSMCETRAAQGRLVPPLWLDDDGAIKAAHENLVQRTYGSIHPQVFQIPCNSAILDAGAHYGYFIFYAVESAASQSPTGDHGLHIVAIEPSKTNAERLLSNVNALQCVNVIKGAVDANERIGSFYHDQKSSWNSCMVEQAKKRQKTTMRGSRTEVYNVSVHDMNKMVQNTKVVKIDVEGSDVQILLHLNPKSWQTVEYLFVEYSIAREIDKGIEQMKKDGDDLGKDDPVTTAIETFTKVLKKLETAEFTHCYLPPEVYQRKRWTKGHIRNGKDFVFMARKWAEDQSEHYKILRTKWKQFGTLIHASLTSVDDSDDQNSE